MSTLTRDGGRSLWPIFQRGACVLALAALGACASRMDGAPVVDRTGALPGIAATGAGLGMTDASSGPPPPGYYRVKPGDTLYRVALDNGQNYRNIIGWNNLTNPNQIEVGQLLRVVPPGANVGPNSPMVAGTPVYGTGVQTAPLGTAAPGGYVSPYATPPGGSAAPSNYPSPYAATPPNGTAAPQGQGGQSVYATPSPYAATPGTPSVSDNGNRLNPTLSQGPDAALNAPAVNTPANTPASTGPVSFIWPVRGQMIRPFNGTTSKGIDIAGSAGTPIMAAAAGRVLYAGNSLRGYGNLIIIKHDATYLTAYGHNRTLLVKENDVVTKGQTIAEMGDTQADRVMLHFEVRQDTKPVDPMKFLPSQ